MTGDGCSSFSKYVIDRRDVSIVPLLERDERHAGLELAGVPTVEVADVVEALTDELLSRLWRRELFEVPSTLLRLAEGSDECFFVVHCPDRSRAPYRRTNRLPPVV